MSFVAELQRRNVIRMAGLYLVGAWLIVQVAQAVLPAFEVPAWVLRAVILLLALGFVPALVFAWVFELTPEGLKRDEDVRPGQSIASQTGRRMDRLTFAGVLAVVVLLAAERFWPSSEPPAASAPTPTAGAGPPATDAGSMPGTDAGPTTVASPAAQKSIAVLAFSNLSEDAGNEHFADGISEELLNVLAKVPELKVAARTSAFHFKGKDTPIPEVARQLGVAYVVEGSVRKAGDRVRITAQLISAADGFHLWSESFDRELKDVFALQDEIAGIIAGKLQLTLGATARAATRVNPEAHTLLLEGRHYWLLRTRDGFNRAEAAYARAIEIDPDFAQAHAAMAELWAIRGWYRLLESEPDADVDFVRARASAERAIALDPALAEPHAALGAVLYNQFRYAESDAEFRRAVELNRNYAGAYIWHGLLLAAMGDPEASVAALERARSLDPLSAVILNTLSGEQFAVGLVEESLATIERAKSLRSEVFLPNYYRSVRARLALGQIEAAVADARVITRERNRSPRWSVDVDAIVALRRAGLETEAQAHADWARLHFPADSYQQGMILAALGRHEEAWPYLERMPPPQTRDVFYWSFWDAVRDTPEFAAMISKLGITEEYRRAREAVARLGRRAAPPSPAASAP
jgi:TolB-like protein